MCNRFLVIMIQMSLILLACGRTSHAQDSPSDLDVGELTSTYAPWLPHSLFESESDGDGDDDVLEPDYALNACDAMPAPDKIQVTQAAWSVSTARHIQQGSNKLRVVRSGIRLHSKPDSVSTADPLRRLRDAIQAAGKRLRMALLSANERDSDHFASS